MEFFIKSGANLPVLKMDVVMDGRTDVGKNFYSRLENAIVRFSMKNEENGIQKIFMKRGLFALKNKANPDSPKEYYVIYKWDEKDTNKKGRYKGEFLIVFDDGELITPIRENLYINII